jgi:hypothetical protein
VGSYTISPAEGATWGTPTHCGPGTVLLAALIKQRWPELLVREGAYGCYARRPITGSTARSVHGDGRALDIGIGWFPSVEQHHAIYELALALTPAVYLLGIQRMLWNRHSWTADRGWRPSTTMGGPHEDHMHLELVHRAAWVVPPSPETIKCCLGLT